jgi:hypothetical protein
MKITSLTRRSSWQGTVIALLTLLALIVSPVCAPLCAARTCATSNSGSAASSSDESCHYSVSSAEHAPDFQFHGTPTCNSGELTAILSTFPNSNELKQESRIVAVSTTGSEQSSFGLTNLHGAGWNANTSSPHRLELSVTTLVLRI